MLTLNVLLLFIFSSRASAIFNPTNETDLSRCKVHYSRSGTSYKDYYDLTNNKPKANDSDLSLDFHFSVLAPSDAHILLAPSRSTQKTDPAYEIVIGAGGNTFCDIRRMQKSAVKESVRIKDLLSALDVRSFWIHMSKEGVLEVGREGEDLAFISWKDPDPLPLSVISFSTWPGIEAKWFFDCITDDLRRIKRNLTELERLRKNLLTNYDPYVRPVLNFSTLTVVNFSPEFHSLFVDEHRSILEIHGVANISWFDEKLVWNETDYGGITQIQVNTMEIWKPNIILYNSVGDNMNIYDNTLLTVDSSGKVSWFPILNLKSWCSSDNFEKWPKDTRKCDLLFTFWTDFAYIQMVYPENSRPFIEHYFSDWLIEEVEVLVNYGENLRVNTNKDDYSKNETDEPSSLDMCLILKRSSRVYDLMLFSPFIIIVIITLCIFCVSPFGSFKIALGCLQLILSILTLIFLEIRLPAQSLSVPHLMLIYSYSILAGTISILISIYVIDLSRNETRKEFPNLMKKLLTLNVVKLIFFLPEIQREQYGKLTLSKVKDAQQYRIICGIIIDRICLIVGIGLASYLLLFF